MTYDQFRAILGKIDRLGYYNEFLLYVMCECDDDLNPDQVVDAIFQIKNNHNYDPTKGSPAASKCLRDIMFMSREYLHFLQTLIDQVL